MSMFMTTATSRYCDSVRVVADMIERLAGKLKSESMLSADGEPWLNGELLGIARILRGATDDYEATYPINVPKNQGSET